MNNVTSYSVKCVCESQWPQGTRFIIEERADAAMQDALTEKDRQIKQLRQERDDAIDCNLQNIQKDQRLQEIVSEKLSAIVAANEQLKNTITGLEAQQKNLAARAALMISGVPCIQHKGWPSPVTEWALAGRCQVCDLEELDLHRRKAKGEYWVWQGDGEDHTESLGCPVLIHQGDLRAMQARIAELEAEIGRLAPGCPPQSPRGVTQSEQGLELSLYPIKKEH